MCLLGMGRTLDRTFSGGSVMVVTQRVFGGRGMMVGRATGGVTVGRDEAGFPVTAATTGLTFSLARVVCSSALLARAVRS